MSLDDKRGKFNRWLFFSFTSLGRMHLLAAVKSSGEGVVDDK